MADQGANWPPLAPSISANDIEKLLGHGTSQVQIGRISHPQSRRARVPIKLTDEEERTLNDEQKRKRKSAIAQERSRARKEQREKDLKDTLCELWNRVQYLENVIKWLHPNESLGNLYLGYTPYTISQSMEPITEPASGDNMQQFNADMSELAWLFDPNNSD
ncbi:hypothetical protein BBJ28_00009682 [Nothophytophthora sp. Chile5]|nr:hypothetical protein BBJ28_00009682 [Nothophytophthora sp. Chile5]